MYHKYDFFDRIVCSQYEYLLSYTIDCMLYREETSLHLITSPTKFPDTKQSFFGKYLSSSNAQYRIVFVCAISNETSIRINKIVHFHKNIVNFSRVPASPHLSPAFTLFTFILIVAACNLRLSSTCWHEW